MGGVGEGVGAAIPPDYCVGAGAGVVVAVAAGALVDVAIGVAVAGSPHAVRAAIPRDANISHRREIIALSS